MIIFFLFDFVFFFDRQRPISKLQFISTYVLITNNLKLATTSLNMKPILWKMEVLIHSNGFRIGILFQNISMTFSEKILIIFFLINLLNSCKNLCKPYTLLHLQLYQKKATSQRLVLMIGFNIYLPAGKMVENIEFNKPYSTEKVLHDIKSCVVTCRH